MRHYIFIFLLFLVGTTKPLKAQDIPNGTQFIILQNRDGALTNEVQFKQLCFDKGITIAKIDTLCYLTEPKKYPNRPFFYRYKALIRNGFIKLSVYDKMNVTLDFGGVETTDDWDQSKVIFGRKSPFHVIFNEAYDLISQIPHDNVRFE